MLQCAGTVPRKGCLDRIIAGRHGYTGAPTPQAIVLHKITSDIGTYEGEMFLPLAQDWNTQGHVEPLSVHFLVTPTGSLQYAELTDTTLGLDYISGPSWPFLVHLYPIVSPNAPFIHVGLVGVSGLSLPLISLLCCIIREVGLDLPIVAASDLQCDRPVIELDPTLITQVKDCVATPVLPPPTFPDLQEQIHALELCCLQNSARITQLTGKVINLESEMADVKYRITNIETNISSLFTQVAAIPILQAQLQDLQDIVTGILDRCCPDDPDTQACFHYRLTPPDVMFVTPHQPVRVNLKTKIVDYEPPIVTTGPLWRAKLLGTCTWPLSMIVRLQLAQWCNGKKARLYLVACGNAYLIDEKVAVGDGARAVTLEGTFPLPPGCEDVHLKVDIDDNVGKIIEFAEFRGCGCL